MFQIERAESEDSQKKKNLVGKVGSEDPLYAISKPISLPELAQEVTLKIIDLVLKLFFMIFSFCVGIFLLIWGYLGFVWFCSVRLMSHTKKSNDSEDKVAEKEL